MDTAPHQPLDLLDGALYEGDPEPAYQWLRREAPVYWDETNSLWAVSKHADIVGIERNTKVYSSAAGSRPNIPGDPSMINTDDPHHTQLRRLFSKRITPRGVKHYESFVRQVAKELVDAVVERGECDVVRDLAVPLPVRTIVHALGLRDEDWDRYRHIAEVTMRAGGGPRYMSEEVGEAFMDFVGLAKDAITERRERGDAHEADDMLSTIVAAADSGRVPRDDNAMASEALLLLNGGSDTTRHVIAGGTLALLEHPEQWTRLANEPATLETGIEELIRWVSPLLNMRRTATCDTVLRGQKIREGDQVLLMYAAANRDEEAFDDPQRFDTTRSPNPHIAFGIGTHFCLGANLARLELRAMFGELLSRIENLRLAPGAEPAITSTGFARGLSTLPVEFDVRA